MECLADLVLGNSDKEKKRAKTIIDVSFIKDDFPLRNSSMAAMWVFQSPLLIQRGPVLLLWTAWIENPTLFMCSCR